MFSSTTTAAVESGNHPKGDGWVQPGGGNHSDAGLDTNRAEASSTGVGLSVGGLVDSIVIGGGSGNTNTSCNIGHTCGLGSRNVGGPFEQQQQSSDSPHSHYHNQSTQQQQTTPTNVIPLGHLDRLPKRQDSNMFYSTPMPNLQTFSRSPRMDIDTLLHRPIQRESSFTGGADTTYFINPDGVMETVTTEAAAAATEAYGSHEQALASANCLPPPVPDDTRQTSSRLNSKITYF